eukprot:TRINITY_DN994_c0_g1_i2.p1 TRINITY_DN994_c0_g1~~TRINITY_DN994_c0_g1_i2.p1  ORF type:complete len:524 (-),score=92.69 TRINITY_DN994_c0_g1_i2:240-1811(-)
MDQLIAENEALRHKLSEVQERLVHLEALLQPSETVGQVIPEGDRGLSIIVLGASGDLARKKTYPSCFGLFSAGLLPPQTKIIGYARRDLPLEEFRHQIGEYIKVSNLEAQQKLDQFKSICTYVHTSSYGSDSEMSRLSHYLINSCEEGDANRLYYLALPPSVFVEACKAISTSGQSQTGWTRVIVEKPFGHDLESSNKLSNELGGLFREEQLFRIDHYLGKEMVQNIMVLRFANTIWESVWNRNFIHNVKITFKENFGVGGRAGYFDESGIIRDILQNHLMQILCLVGMEQPVSLEAEDVRDSKVRVLKSIVPPTIDDVVLGQYTASQDGKNKGYLDDPQVPKDSITPTFAQLVLWIKNPRWHGVPFVLKAAKAVEERKAEIRIQFKNNPGYLFPASPRNELIIRVQPSEAIYIKVMNKIPGLSSSLVQSDLDLTYGSKFSGKYSPEAYERLILEAIRGDRGLFVRSDELREAWKIYTPLLQNLERRKIKPIPYAFGSRGPEEADQQLQNLGWERSTSPVSKV